MYLGNNDKHEKFYLIVGSVGKVFHFYHRNHQLFKLATNFCYRNKILPFNLAFKKFTQRPQLCILIFNSFCHSVIRARHYFPLVLKYILTRDKKTIQYFFFVQIHIQQFSSVRNLGEGSNWNISDEVKIVNDEEGNNFANTLSKPISFLFMLSQVFSRHHQHQLEWGIL